MKTAISEAPATGLRIHEFRYDELATAAPALAAIRRGELDAVVIHEFYPPTEATALAQRVDAALATLPHQTAPSCDGNAVCVIVGRALDLVDLVDHGLPSYFEAVPAIEAFLDNAFPTGDFVERLGALFSALAEVPAEVLVHPDGRRYTPATFRCMRPGGVAPLHCEDQKLLQPAKAHIAETVERPLLSYYMALSLPDAGGELGIYDLRWPEVEPLVRGRHAAGGVDPALIRQLIDGRDGRSLTLPPGSLIVHGNACFHEVRCIEGERTRWTLGGFGGFVPGGFRFWS
jgi:hypothetical protein